MAREKEVILLHVPKSPEGWNQYVEQANVDEIGHDLTTSSSTHELKMVWCSARNDSKMCVHFHFLIYPGEDGEEGKGYGSSGSIRSLI